MNGQLNSPINRTAFLGVARSPAKQFCQRSCLERRMHGPLSAERSLSVLVQPLWMLERNQALKIKIKSPAVKIKTLIVFSSVRNGMQISYSVKKKNNLSCHSHYRYQSTL